MSAMKNFFAKKGERIDGSVAVLVVFGALVISSVNVASATPAQAPVVTSQTVVTSGGDALGNTVVTGGGSQGMVFSDK